MAIREAARACDGYSQGIDGLILVAPAIVAPMFRTSRAPSSSGRCQKEGNALRASFEGPERLQEDTKRRSVHALHLRSLKCLAVSSQPFP